jgi:phosphotriesterase-related protein
MQPATTQPVMQTVLGPVDPDLAGRVLMHEHLLCLLPGPWQSGGPRGQEAFAEEQVAVAVSALSGLAAHGVGTVVDVSPYGDAGRDPAGANVTLLQEISRRSGLHVVAGTATYREEFSPDWVRQASAEVLTARFIADATTGIGGTGVRAGLLGEQPTSEGRVTAHEERGLRAAARAHLATGLAISTHTTHGTMALEQIAILREEGADLTRVVIGHLDQQPDLDYVRRVLHHGVTVAFDSVGKQVWDVRVAPGGAGEPDGEFAKKAIRRADAGRARRLARLAAEGYAGQIVLSHDLVGVQVPMNAGTHGRWGYRYLSAVFLPLLESQGVTRAQIEQMMGANPKRILVTGLAAAASPAGRP